MTHSAFQIGSAKIRCYYDIVSVVSQCECELYFEKVIIIINDSASQLQKQCIPLFHGSKLVSCGATQCDSLIYVNQLLQYFIRN